MDSPEEGPPPLLTEPEDGVPFVIDTERGLQRCAEALAAGTGPVAVDAERASGFRYGQRAFLVQLKREGSGLWLIDPEPFTTLAPVQEALDGVEWILHAATQDLPCLAELGMHPHSLFDTELAARLGGLPRSASARWWSPCWGSAWPRNTRPLTGPGARCPRTGCAMPPWTWSC